MKTSKSPEILEYDINQLKSDMQEIKANQVEIKSELKEGFKEVRGIMKDHEKRIYAIEISKELEDRLKKDTKTDVKWTVDKIIAIVCMLVMIVMMVEKFIN